MKKKESILRNVFPARSLALILSLGMALSCSQPEPVAPVPDPVQSVGTEKIIDYLANTTGFAKEAIVFDAEKALFVIDDDILISLEDAQARTKAANGGRTEHWRSNYLVSNTYVTNIKYYIEPNVPADWKTATRQSINNWNAINGTRLGLSEVTTRSQADVVVNLGFAEANWVARAYLPYSNGRPGNTVTINTKYNGLSASRKQFTMTHEMGHNFGLLHTNQTSGVFIQGTPQSDPNSVMNSSVLPWNGFTSGDAAAVQIIYPN